MHDSFESTYRIFLLHDQTPISMFYRSSKKRIRRERFREDDGTYFFVESWECLPIPIHLEIVIFFCLIEKIIPIRKESTRQKARMKGIEYFTILDDHIRVSLFDESDSFPWCMSSVHRNNGRIWQEYIFIIMKYVPEISCTRSDGHNITTLSDNTGIIISMMRNIPGISIHIFPYPPIANIGHPGKYLSFMVKNRYYEWSRKESSSLSIHWHSLAQRREEIIYIPSIIRENNIIYSWECQHCTTSLPDKNLFSTFITCMKSKDIIYSVIGQWPYLKKWRRKSNTSWEYPCSSREKVLQ